MRSMRAQTLVSYISYHFEQLNEEKQKRAINNKENWPMFVGNK